jgi:hypothetical protein
VIAARNAGFRSPNADHTIFYDGTGGCGIGTYHHDERLIAENANNSGGGYGITYRGCWGYNTAMHESGHNQGAVQPTAPYSTGDGAHCMDEADVMCYSDGGDRDRGTFSRCSIEKFDCGYDTYFDARTEAGEWLSTHWNLGSSLNRFVAFDAYAPRPASRPSVDAGADHSASFAFRHDHDGATAGDADGDLVSYSWTCRPVDDYSQCPEGATKSGTLPSGSSAVSVPGPSFHMYTGYQIELTLTVRDAAGNTALDTVREVGF